MAILEEKLARSLTANTPDLIPYLPYLLQDLWELGSSPKDMLDLIEKGVDKKRPLRILDLACGKGAVSVHLAKELDCYVKGVDILPAFILFAREKAKEEGVEDRCIFFEGDINEVVCTEKDYDLVIFGAAGDVLGNPKETLEKLKGTLKEEGYILLDDAYGEEELGFLSSASWKELFSEEGLVLLQERFIQEEELVALNVVQQALIRKRAEELRARHPEKSALFDGYVLSQQEECDLLEGKVQGVTLLLKKCC